MRWSHAVTAAVLGTGLVGSVAQASLAVSLVPVNISAGAISADGTLSNARSFDLQVTQASGEKWNVSVLQTALATGGNLSGSFYTPTGHSNIKSNSPATANLAYDTSFSTPQWGLLNDGSHIDILGNSDYPNPAGAGVTPTVGPSSISIAWGDHQGTSAPAADGTYTIARLTIVGNTGAYLNGYSAGNINANNAQLFSNLYLPIRGDINADHVVDQSDLTVIVGHWQQTNVGYANGDLNLDGIVDQTDLTQIVGSWQNVMPPPAGASLGSLVPEPGSLGLLVLAGAASLRRRRRA